MGRANLIFPVVIALYISIFKSQIFSEVGILLVLSSFVFTRFSKKILLKILDYEIKRNNSGNFFKGGNGWGEPTSYFTC